MRKIILFLKFWECWCWDTHHPGDNPDCPRHGFWPSMVRVAIFMAIAMIAIAILANLK